MKIKHPTIPKPTSTGTTGQHHKITNTMYRVMRNSPPSGVRNTIGASTIGATGNSGYPFPVIEGRQSHLHLHTHFDLFLIAKEKLQTDSAYETSELLENTEYLKVSSLENYMDYIIDVLMEQAQDDISYAIDLVKEIKDQIKTARDDNVRIRRGL